MTWLVDEKVRRCAELIEDSRLLGKLSAGDMIATEAKYHPECLLNLYHRAARIQPSQNTDQESDGHTAELNSESLALADVIGYMENIKCNDVTPSVFKLSELTETVQ